MWRSLDQMGNFRSRSKIRPQLLHNVLGTLALPQLIEMENYLLSIPWDHPGQPRLHYPIPYNVHIAMFVVP